MLNRKLYIDDKEMELGEISFPLNLQCSDVADLTNVVCNYSFTIKLPLTPVNLINTGQSQVIANQDIYPFQYHSARYYVDGIPLFENGTARILRITDSIEITLAFGNYELIGLIDKLKLKELNITDVLNWNYSLASSTNAGFGIGQFGETIVSGKLYPQRVAPYVKAKSLFDLIIPQYDMPSSIQSHLTGLTLPLTTKNSELQYLNDVLSTVFQTSNLTIFSANENGTKQFANLFGSIFTNVYSDNYSLTFVVATQRFFSSPISGFYKFSFKLKINTLPDIINGVVQIVEASSGDVIDSIFWGYPYNDVFSKSIKLEAEKNYYATFTCTKTGDTIPAENVIIQGVGTNFIKFEFDTANSDNDLTKTGFKLKYPIKNNLPDVTQKDFVKSIMQLYGLMLQIIDGVPFFFTFNEVYANFTNAFDWSDYLVEENRNDEYVDFSSDIAEENHLKWKEDNTVTAGYGDAVIPANNQFLKERTILTNQMYSASESTTEVDLSGNVCGMCKFGMYEKQTNGSYKTTNIKQRVCMGVNKNMNLSMQSVFGEATGIGSGAVQRKVYCFEGSQMTYEELVSNFWGSYSAMIDKFKQVKRKFIIPVTELSKFRFDYPIYIKKYQRYFFVKRINNWEANKVVEIDLIVL